ncbi:SDR family oxidoreductase [Peribacillus psychrosaccharolyticus]|uniref:SDR family oxidoreductase n=1 Tax=Peribacillus psychrosaccharolyticus TaxID=1407 RepID=A0A974NQK5_PERPY|nr:SDR family oxidoreductase [Peribacillus psychrosaccharolyticus]MEC2055096.1 SDR family oxidoreductase [Peribacillus psychrosaccharolyticus]MED3743852.1 SDR family oxidoreductase [Peribacillus psychrosaccharolyticus]QQT01995.1 SDR family oxidoreductase [Peribacillus psychrosaccharolyticus]
MNIYEQQKEGQPGQTQPQQPGIESEMTPLPVQPINYIGSGKLKDRVALITGGDSGIGRAVAIAYAKEGAHVVVNYLNEHSDAEETKALVEAEGVRCLLLPADVSEEENCKELVQKTIDEFGKLDILVNNAAVQYPTEKIEDITAEQWDKTFRTNIHSVFYMSKHAVPHMTQGNTIINTTSINPYRGHAILMDYTATKGAIVGFTRSLAQNLAEKGIRVNMVAPGPIWTPLIPATFNEKQVEEFGSDAPLGRPGQPADHAGAYVLLASDESVYITGQCIHINGGITMSS